jgi:uncharacterized protein (TIGR03067 family)
LTDTAPVTKIAWSLARQTRRGILAMQPSLLLGLSLVVGAPGLKDRPAKQDSIEGEWAIVSRIIGGREDAKASGSSADFRITADRWVLLNPGGASNESELKLDSSAKPPTLTTSPLGGAPAAGGHLIGIYKLEGDMLTICYVFQGERPTKFESPAGTDTRLMTLKRVREK